MLIISQNMENYDLVLPKEAVFRINLAWCNSLEELEDKLAKNKKSEFFIDLPVGRVKPPNNSYSLNDMLPIIEANPRIRYFAVSNVENNNVAQNNPSIVKEMEGILEELTKNVTVESMDDMDDKRLKRIQEELRLLGYRKT